MRVFSGDHGLLAELIDEGALTLADVDPAEAPAVAIQLRRRVHVASVASRRAIAARLAEDRQRSARHRRTAEGDNAFKDLFSE